MVRIILIRHGESEGNKEGLFRGRWDFPLTQNGIEQAEALQKELKDFDISAIYSSPLKRAHDTAKIVALPHQLDVVIDENFNNICLGEWEGKPKEYIKEHYPDLWKIWITEPEKLRFPDIETLDMVMERSVNRLRELVQLHSEGTFAIVTHRAVLKPLIAGILEMTPPYFWKIHMDTASYSILEYDKVRGYTLSLLNQTKHIKKLIKEYF